MIMIPQVTQGKGKNYIAKRKIEMKPFKVIPNPSSFQVPPHFLASGGIIEI